jgi:hypothetical protein
MIQPQEYAKPAPASGKQLTLHHGVNKKTYTTSNPPQILPDPRRKERDWRCIYYEKWTRKCDPRVGAAGKLEKENI